MMWKIHRHVSFTTEKFPGPDGGRVTYMACMCGALKPMGGWRWRPRARIAAAAAVS